MKQYWLIILILLPGAMAHAETKTLSTYYPAPNGRYRLMDVDQDLAIGRNLIAAHEFTVNNMLTVGTCRVTAALNVTGNEDIGGSLSVRQDFTVGGRIGTNGLEPAIGLPGGWGGGLHTRNVYSDGGTISAGPAGSAAINAYISGLGVYGSRDFMVGRHVVVTGDIVANTGDIITGGGGDIVAGGNITAGGNLRGGGAIVAGGLMHAAGDITAGGVITAAGTMTCGGTVAAGGRLTVGNDLYIGGRIEGATQGFGGIFQIHACDSTCRIVNFYTGGCNCPSGYTQVGMNSWLEWAPCGSWSRYEGRGMVQIVCVK